MPGSRGELVIVVAYIAFVALVGGGMVAVVQGQHRARPTAPAPLESPDHAPPRSGPLVAGTGVAIPLLQELAAAFNPTAQRPVTIAPSIGSSGALAALRDGAIDAGAVSRALTADERSDLRVVPLADATVVLAAGAGVPAGEIAADELLSLYSGETRAWRETGPVSVVLREPGDSATRAFGQRLSGFGEVHEQARGDEVWRSVFTDLAMQRALADNPRSLGLFDRGTIALRGLPLHELEVTGLQGGGPVTRPVALVLPPVASPEIEAFVAFATGPRGQEIVAQSGYVPATPPAAPPGAVE